MTKDRAKSAPYKEVVSAVRERGVTQVAVFGHSHGGGATWDLADKLTDNVAIIQKPFEIRFTAYIDGIKSLVTAAETRLPPGTLLHANYYQRHLIIRGDSVPGSTPDTNVNETEWGKDLTHTQIDDNVRVQNAIKDALRQEIAR